MSNPHPTSSIPPRRRWEAGGESYPVNRLSYLALSELMDFIAEKVPDPRVQARKLMDGLPAETQQFLWREMTTVETEEDDGRGGRVRVRRPIPWPPSPNSPEAMRAIMSRDGQAIVVYHALRKGMAEMTRDRAAQVVDGLGEGEFERLLELCMGDDGRPKDGDQGTTTPTETTTSP